MSEALVSSNDDGIIRSGISDGYGANELRDNDLSYDQLFDMYLKPMQEMSYVLNERLAGYHNISTVFRKSFAFAITSSDETINAIDEFVDRVINDYIQIFMIKEPELKSYINKIIDNSNKASEKKYFKLTGDISDLEENTKNNLLFVLDVLTSCFDIFYHHYRGKITINNEAGHIEVDSVYEVRKNRNIESFYKFIMSAVNNIFSGYASSVKSGVKDNIIQYRILIN